MSNKLRKFFNSELRIPTSEFTCTCWRKQTDENFNYQKILMFLSNNNQPNQFGIIINGMSKLPAFSRIKVVQVETQGKTEEYEVGADYPIERLLTQYQLTNIISVQTTFFWQRNWDEEIDGEF